MSDMAIEREQYMETDLEEEISIGIESYMLLHHQEPSFNFEDCEEDEEKESDIGMWQTRSKRNVCAALPVYRSTTWSAGLKYCTQSPTPELLKFLFLSDLLKSTCTVSSIMLQKVMTTQYLRKKCSTFLL
jgi:hypothetical protein